MSKSTDVMAQLVWRKDQGSCKHKTKMPFRMQIFKIVCPMRPKCRQGTHVTNLYKVNYPATIQAVSDAKKKKNLSNFTFLSLHQLEKDAILTMTTFPICHVRCVHSDMDLLVLFLFLLAYITRILFINHGRLYHSYPLLI